MFKDIYNFITFIYMHQNCKIYWCVFLLLRPEKQMSSIFSIIMKWSENTIYYVESSKHLGNEISTVNKKLLIQNAKCDLKCRMNSLLVNFSYCKSDTVSMLFKSYCMNIYGSQIWKFYNKEVNILYTT